MTENQISTWMLKAVNASVDAGIAILEIYETEFEVKKKEDESPLTQADMESHAIISERLHSTGLPVLSEEGRDIPFEVRKDWELFWLVDPLDGTKEFINRNGEFTVNIALIGNGYPLAGVIYIPAADELYLGMEGLGSFKFIKVKENLMRNHSLADFTEYGQQLPQKQRGRPFTVVGSRSHMSAETEAFIGELRSEHPQLEFSSRGSSLKLCMVAEGKADIYPRFAPTMEWDTAAGQAIAECSGATVIQSINMERLRYNKANLLNPWFIVKR